MSKIPCAVIQDLMALYEDDVISEESRKLVEDHINECDECRILYEKTQAPLPDITTDEDDSTKAVNERAVRSIKNLKQKLAFRHIIIPGLILIAVLVAYYIWSECLSPYIYSVPSDDIRVTELYELKNGDIYCTLKADKSFTEFLYDSLRVPLGKESVDYSEGWYELHFGYPRPFDKLTHKYNTISFIFPREDKSPPCYAAQYTHSCASIYYKGRSDDDRLTIWKEGQNVEPAPGEIEQKAREALQDNEINIDPSSYPLAVEP